MERRCKNERSKLNAACAVFEGNVVVAGGWDKGFNKLGSVAIYDVIADKWWSMPNMVSGKSGHSSVVLQNKLYVIGAVDVACEVYNKTSKKFVEKRVRRKCKSEFKNNFNFWKFTEGIEPLLIPPDSCGWVTPPTGKV